MAQEPIKIDGSLGEGGGQVLRIALCLSALYKIPIEISRIRAGRPKPGLSAQHLKGVELLKEMCNAKVCGDHIGSTCLAFHPGDLLIKKQEFVADTQTAGCIGLLVQIALPCALFSSRAATYILKGGTNVPFGPHIEYIKHVFRPMLNRFGGDIELDVVRKGYYPRGGGEVHMHIAPIHSLKGIELLDVGVDSKIIKGWSYVAGTMDMNEALKIANHAETTIRQELSKRDISVPSTCIKSYKEFESNAVGDGYGINLVCETTHGGIFGGSGLGTKKPNTISPGVEAANQVIAPILMDSCIDEHMQDQIIILMVLANGISKIKIGRNELTCHAQTAKQVAEIMLGDKGLSFSLNKNENGSYILECNGLGLINKYLN